VGILEPLEPILQLRLIAVRAEKATDVVISDAREIGEIGAKNIRDQFVPGVRVAAIIEIALMKHEIGALRLDEPQNRAGAVAQTLVGDERDSHRSRQLGAIGPGLMDPPIGGGKCGDETE
jgi:hypothetical protein